MNRFFVNGVARGAREMQRCIPNKVSAYRAARHALLIGITILSTVAAEAAMRKIDILTPRNYGYVIGDRLKHEVRVSLETPYRVDEQSLPAAGRINRWLWLHTPELDKREYSDATVYHLRLVYQLLSAPKGVEELFTPEWTLYVTDGTDRLPLIVTPWRFTAAPLVNRDPDDIAYTDIQPALPPPPIPIRGYWIGLAAAVAALTAATILLCYVHWMVPFLARSNGPFSRALRTVSRLVKSPHADRDTTAFRVVHRAFDETAGCVVFPETLTDFFRDHPEFEHLRADIERFFRASRARFFETDFNNAPHVKIGTLKTLCHACRDIERGVA